jgi:hypothetical protein
MSSWYQSVKSALARRDLPAFYEIVLVLLLLASAKLAVSRWIDPFKEVGEQVATTAEYRAISIAALFPESWLRSSTFHRICSSTLFVASLAWLLKLWPRFSSVVTIVTLVLQMSLLYTFDSVLHHRYHLLAQSLLAFAIATFCMGAESDKSVRVSTSYWQRRVYPSWLFVVVVYLIGLSYTLSAITKFAESGIDWCSGTGLQAHMWKSEELFKSTGASFASALRQTVLNNHGVATVLAVSTLLLELVGVVALCGVFTRRFIGVSLLAFHFGAWLTLGILFPVNILLLIMFFVIGVEVFDREAGVTRLWRIQESS